MWAEQKPLIALRAQIDPLLKAPGVIYHGMSYALCHGTLTLALALALSLTLTLILLTLTLPPPLTRYGLGDGASPSLCCGGLVRLPQR